MIKKLKNRIEEKRNSKSILWRSLVSLKDFFWFLELIALNSKMRKASNISETFNFVTGAKFLIFAFPRTGSTTLQLLLESHPAISCELEPFKARRCIEDYRINSREKVQDLESLKKVLGVIYNKHNGIRHHGKQLPFELNKYLLLHPNIKIIFLFRENFLQREISHFISLESGHWGRDRSKVLAHKYKNMNINSIKKSINSNKAKVEKYKKILTENNKEFFEVTYEELFGLKLIEEKLRKLNAIFSFLGYGEIKDKTILEKMKTRLDPLNSKLNSEETYRLIPNIYEVERELGSPENGYLFKSVKEVGKNPNKYKK